MKSSEPNEWSRKPWPTVDRPPRASQPEHILARQNLCEVNHASRIHNFASAPMVPIILQVISEDGVTDVPITPETTCYDVVQCCRDPGDDSCALVQVWRGYKRVLEDDERPLEIMQEWGPQQSEVKFLLRYTLLPSNQGEEKPKRNGMKEQQGLITDSLPDGVELSLWELQEMATRQQEQIESQHQILVAKEQRLRYLKHQEAKNHQVVAENERLRRLKDRVEAQELKLRKLRALRGQVDQDKISNGNLTCDLESIRALFNEKEKELSLAVAKVEELTRQLEDLKRNGRSREAQPPTSAALELDKLRRELLFRNKLKEQQSAQINQQRDALNKRQEEIRSIDDRITELQDRLQRKRQLNQQLAGQLQQNNCAPVRNNKHGLLTNHQRPNVNVAAVEPYLHVPNTYHQKNDVIHANDDFSKLGPKPKNIDNEGRNTDKDNNNDLPLEFAGSKSDPKYQTLPCNTRFHGTAYGKPVNGNGDPPRIPSHLNPRVYGPEVGAPRAQPIGGTSPSSSTSSLATSTSSGSSSNPGKLKPGAIGKPMSSVAPTTIIPKPARSVPAGEKPSPIYHTTSTKVSLVQPQTLDSTPQGIQRDARVEFTPPITSSTPLHPAHDADPHLSKTDSEVTNTKPALPPKPAVPIKPTPPPPPRQTPETKGYVEITAESLDQAILSVNLDGKGDDLPPPPPELQDDKSDTIDEVDRVSNNNNNNTTDGKAINNINIIAENITSGDQQIVRRRKGNLKSADSKGSSLRRVSFDPLALLLDASLEGELELVRQTACQVANPSAANDEGITALHNAICAGHLDIVHYLVEFGCDVNAQDSDGWTPLHCAASCNNLSMVKFLVEHGACIFATTLSDHETAAEKCEEDEEGFDGCSEYLYSIQEKLGIMNNGVVYAVFDYIPHNTDELGFREGDQLVVLRKGDEVEREWWWCKHGDHEGYTPRNLLGLLPRVRPPKPPQE